MRVRVSLAGLRDLIRDVNTRERRGVKATFGNK